MMTMRGMHSTAPFVRAREFYRFRTWSRFSGKRPVGLVDWQDRNLTQLVHHAAEHSPFYRNLFANNDVDVRNISVDGMRDMPVVTRDELRQSRTPVRIPGLPAWAYRNRGATSGSTGEPLAFTCTPFAGPCTDIEQRYIYSKLWRPLLWDGYKLADLQHQIRMVQNSHFRNVENSVQLFIDPHSTTNTPLMSVQAIAEFRPMVISCYASFLVELCNHMEKQDVYFDFTVPYILLNGETVTAEQRAFIERVLGGKTYSRYGLEEMYWSVACEDGTDSGLIPYYESVIIEIVDENGRPCEIGEEGRIVITDLCNFIHPFIRYDTGDIGTLLEGPPYTRFALESRSNSLTFGERMLTHNTTNRLATKCLSDIERYQLRKHSDTQLEVLVVPRATYSPIVERLFREEIVQVLGPDVAISYTLTDSIPRTSRGKTRTFIDLTDTTA